VKAATGAGAWPRKGVRSMALRQPTTSLESARKPVCLIPFDAKIEEEYSTLITACPVRKLR
jgi:hypothetical protein